VETIAQSLSLSGRTAFVVKRHTQLLQIFCTAASYLPPTVLTACPTALGVKRIQQMAFRRNYSRNRNISITDSL
jgi:hypothetical protein